MKLSNVAKCLQRFDIELRLVNLSGLNVRDVAYDVRLLCQLAYWLWVLCRVVARHGPRALLGIPIEKSDDFNNSGSTPLDYRVHIGSE